MTPAQDDSLKLSSQLCFAVYSAVHAFTAAYKPLLEPLGLTYPQYLVLLVLWEEDELMVKQIGERLHLDSGTLTPMLKRMEAGGYITRRRDQADERQVRVTLAPQGQEIRALAQKGRHALVCSMGKSEADIQAIKSTLDGLLSLLREAPCPVD